MPKSDLRLADLVNHDRGPMKLMNVKVPDTVMDGIERVAAALRCSKTAAVVALINEGLDAVNREAPPKQAANRTTRPRRAQPSSPAADDTEAPVAAAS